MYILHNGSIIEYTNADVGTRDLGDGEVVDAPQQSLATNGVALGSPRLREMQVNAAEGWSRVIAFNDAGDQAVRERTW
jgi:hypothetical protein